MYEYETFDEISKKTLTIDKNELGKLIQALHIDLLCRSGDRDQYQTYEHDLSHHSVSFYGFDCRWTARC